MTGSGRYFDPLDPRPETVHMRDIERGLRRGVAARFNGQLLDPTVCPHPQSGIAHSYRVGRLVFWRMVKTRPSLLVCPTRAEAEDLVAVVLGGMIHDAPEGYMGDDLGPIKTPERKAMEDVVLAAIAEHLVGSEWGPIVCGHVHDNEVAWADRLALYQEALLYQPGAQDWALPDHDGTCGRTEVAETLHLFHPREGEDWLGAVGVLASDLLDGAASVDVVRHLMR